MFFTRLWWEENSVTSHHCWKGPWVSFITLLCGLFHRRHCLYEASTTLAPSGSSASNCSTSSERVNAKVLELRQCSSADSSPSWSTQLKFEARSTCIQVRRLLGMTSFLISRTHLCEGKNTESMSSWWKVCTPGRADLEADCLSLEPATTGSPQASAFTWQESQTLVFVILEYIFAKSNDWPGIRWCFP